MITLPVVAGDNQIPLFLNSLDKEKIKKEKIMTKKEMLKWSLQIIVSIASAILTALGATSCMGF